MRNEIDFALDFPLGKNTYFSALQLIDAGVVRKTCSDTELQNICYEMVHDRRNSGVVVTEMSNMTLAPSITKYEIQMKEMENVCMEGDSRTIDVLLNQD